MSDFHWHWSNENERRDGTTGPATHGRAWFHHTPLGTIGIEWLLWRGGSVLLDVQGGGHYEADLSVAVSIGPALFLNVEAPWATRLAKALGLHPEKEIRLAIHDGALWWSFQMPINEWQRGEPWWRRFTLHLDDLVLGKQVHKSTVIEERRVVVPMPERNYIGTAKLELATWERPRWRRKECLSVQIDMDTGEQIPVPGKGENSYDCDEDAIFGASYPATSIDEGIGVLVASALKTRRRHGGELWRPAARPPRIVA